MAVTLVLLMGGIYEVHRWSGLRCHDTHTKFDDDRFRHLSTITVITATIWEAVILVLLIEATMEYAVEMASWGMIYIPSFMKIGAGVKELLRRCLRNLRGCHVGIIYGRDLWFTGSGAVIYMQRFIKFGWGIQKLMGGYTYRHTDTHIERQQGDLISLILLFQNKESGLLIRVAW
jgi:hypothetical protein